MPESINIGHVLIAVDSLENTSRSFVGGQCVREFVTMEKRRIDESWTYVSEPNVYSLCVAQLLQCFDIGTLKRFCSGVRWRRPQSTDAGYQRDYSDVVMTLPDKITVGSPYHSCEAQGIGTQSDFLWLWIEVGIHLCYSRDIEKEIHPPYSLHKLLQSDGSLRIGDVDAAPYHLTWEVLGQLWAQWIFSVGRI